MKKDINLTFADKGWYVDYQTLRKKKQARCKHIFTKDDIHPSCDKCGYMPFWTEVCDEIEKRIFNPNFRIIIR